jgi:antitoxin Phd
MKKTLRPGRTTLKSFSTEQDALLHLMQTPKARKGMERAFNASPAELGRAAVLAKRGNR